MHLLLFVLSAALIALSYFYLVHRVPGVGAWVAHINDQFKNGPGNEPWYGKVGFYLLQVMATGPMQIGLAALVLVPLALAVFGLGWIAQTVLSIVLWTAIHLLDLIAAALGSRRLRGVMRVLALSGIVLPEFLPDRLPC